MKKIISNLLALCLVLGFGSTAGMEGGESLIAESARAASGEAAPAEAVGELEGDFIENGVLNLAAYNVSGIPLIGNFQGSAYTTTKERAKLIGQLLNTLDVDFIGVEEDFNGHKYLAEQMTDYPYRSETSGGVVIGQGLNIFSDHKLYNINRVNWDVEYGKLSGSSDALSNKGFIHSVMELKEGVYINVIVVHMDAGYDLLSRYARADNMRQLAKYINNNCDDGRALIVLGDFNFKFKRRLSDDMYNNLLLPTGLKDIWAELYNNGIYDVDDENFNLDDSRDTLDRVLYRSGKYVTLQPVERLSPSLVGENGERYTDHLPMVGKFNYYVSEYETDPGELNDTEDTDTAFVAAVKELFMTFVRIIQVLTGIFELPYLAAQGVAELVNDKMP